MTTTDDTISHVLMLTDGFALESVHRMSTPTSRPPLYSVTFRTDDNLRAIIATERQMIQLRDELDRAVHRARTANARKNLPHGFRFNWWGGDDQ